MVFASSTQPAAPPRGVPAPWKPSVTVAAVIERDGRFLMVEEQTTDGIRLNQPAGHLDRGETLLHAAARETLEETAYHFTPTALLGVYMARSDSSDARDATTYVRFAFTGTLGGCDQHRALDEGILRAVWLTPAEIRSRIDRHRSPLVMKCVADYESGARYPLSFLYTHPSALSA